MTGGPEHHLDLSGLPAEVLAQAIEEARADAVAELRSRIARWLVQSAEPVLPVGDPGSGPAGSVQADRPPVHPRPEPAEVPPVPEPAVVRTAGGGSGGRGWYVYGLTWNHVASALPASAGVEGAAVEVVPVGRLAMVGSWVEESVRSWGLDESGEADLARLEPLVRAHEGVLEAVLDRGAVLPLRFGRMYRHPDQLRDLMDRRSDAISAALERLEGRAEWGLTLDWDPGHSAQPTVTDPGDAGGAGYLARRRDQIAAADGAGRAARDRAHLVHECLAAIADDQVAHPVRRRSGRSRPVVWRASYLVAATRIEAFRQTAAEGLSEAPAELGLSGELTGPWPAYNFSHLELEPVPA